jgi:hypothetical protein
MADISVTTPPKSRAAAAIEHPTSASEPCWDLIELLFFAYRDFVGDPDEVLAKLAFGRAHHRVLHFVNRNPGMKVADLLDVLKITKQSLGRVLKQLIEALQLAGPQTARIASVLAELGPGGHEAARRFLAGMINAEDRDHVLHLIAQADGSGRRSRDGAS